MTKKIKKQKRIPSTFGLHMIKNRQEVDGCPTRGCCVDLWGGAETFASIRNLTKFELMYKQDELIFEAGDPVTSLYVIQSGAVKLEKMIEGDVNHINGFYFTGEIIGLDSFGDEQCSYNAVALEDTCVCEIRINKLASLGKSAMEIQQRVSILLGQKLRETDKHLYCTRYLLSDQRLFNFFKFISTKNLKQVEGGSSLYHLPIRKADIANFLGMRSETLSRTLRQFESQGFVNDCFSRKTIVIDKQKLLIKNMEKTA